LPALR